MTHSSIEAVRLMKTTTVGSVNMINHGLGVYSHSRWYCINHAMLNSCLSDCSHLDAEESDSRLMFISPITKISLYIDLCWQSPACSKSRPWKDTWRLEIGRFVIFLFPSTESGWCPGLARDLKHLPNSNVCNLEINFFPGHQQWCIPRPTIQTELLNVHSMHGDIHSFRGAGALRVIPTRNTCLISSQVYAVHKPAPPMF